jgi:hypothetical protein
VNSHEFSYKLWAADFETAGGGRRYFWVGVFFIDPV